MHTLSCVSLQATKKPAHRQAGFLRTGRYTPCTDSLSRPIVGHTPRKLPPFGAISRIIAVCVLSDAPLSYNTRPCVSRGFFKFFWHIFKKIRRSLCAFCGKGRGLPCRGGPNLCLQRLQPDLCGGGVGGQALASGHAGGQGRDLSHSVPAVALIGAHL